MNNLLELRLGPGGRARDVCAPGPLAFVQSSDSMMKNTDSFPRGRHRPRLTAQPIRRPPCFFRPPQYLVGVPQSLITSGLSYTHRGTGIMESMRPQRGD